MSTRPRFILLVTGSRDATNAEHCKAMRKALEAVAAKVPPAAWEWHLVHGGADGADAYCAQLVRIMHWCEDAHIHDFPANWTSHGRAAGPRRNAQMVAWVVNEQSSDLARVGCVAFPAEQDQAEDKGGTLDCVRRAKLSGIAVKVVPLDVSAERAARLARARR